MNTIDRYLLKQFLQIYVICFISLAGLYIVFDAFSNLDNFMQYAEARGGLLALLGEYYSYRVVFFFDRTSGILVLVSAMFTVAWIQRHNELTALLAAGIPARRILKPIIVAALLISFAAAANRELLIPRMADKLARNPKDLMGVAAQALQPKYDNETDILFRGKATLARDQKIIEPSLLLPRTLDAYGRQLAAESAIYVAANRNRPGGYLLRKVSFPKGLSQRPTLYLNNRPVIITPKDDPQTLKPDECFVVSQVGFEQLTGGFAWRQFSSTWSMIQGLRNPSLDFGADVRVAIHQRILNPLLDLTLFFLGLPLILSSERQKPFVAIGMCLIVVVVYMLTILGMQFLGSASLMAPALAAWAPLLIFVPVVSWISEPLWV